MVDSGRLPGLEKYQERLQVAQRLCQPGLIVRRTSEIGKKKKKKKEGEGRGETGRLTGTLLTPFPSVS